MEVPTCYSNRGFAVEGADWAAFATETWLQQALVVALNRGQDHVARLFCRRGKGGIGATAPGPSTLVFSRNEVRGETRSWAAVLVGGPWTAMVPENVVHGLRREPGDRLCRGAVADHPVAVLVGTAGAAILSAAAVLTSRRRPF